MNIIVTGAAGFIGANFVYYLLEKYGSKNKIICIDKLTYAGNKENLEEALCLENLSFYKEDICNKTAMKKIFLKEKPNVVVNFAAESHVDNSLKNPENFLKTNILGVQVLMELCISGSVRFHQVSTDEVYGDLPLEPMELKFTESSALKPSSPYAASKAAADLLVFSYIRSYGLKATISRCTNNFGRFQHSEKMVPTMINKCIKNEEMPLYGSGNNVRDWIHVSDHCRAIDLIINKGSLEQIYNVGANNQISNLNLAKRICTLGGKPKSLIAFVKDRPGHDLRYAVDYTKITNELGFKPEAAFEKEMKELINSFRNR